MYYLLDISRFQTLRLFQSSVAILEAVEAADVEPPWPSAHTMSVSVNARSEAATADTFAVEEWHFGLSLFFR